MFQEIEGGTQMQPKKIGGTWGKSLGTPVLVDNLTGLCPKTSNFENNNP